MPATESFHIVGPYGEAYELPFLREDPRWRPDWNATLSGWAVYAPKFHPLWDYYYVGCIHLRDIPEVPPAHKNYPEAEYELTIWALDPTASRGGKYFEAAKSRKIHFEFPILRPVNVLFQFHGVTDAQAHQLPGLCIRRIVVDGLSPDSDFRSYWNKALQDTVDHFKAGYHEPR